MRVVTMWSFENRTIYICFCQWRKTPLHYAAEKGLEECVKTMLQLPDIAAVVRMQDKVKLDIRYYILSNIFSNSFKDKDSCIFTFFFAFLLGRKVST